MTVLLNNMDNYTMNSDYLNDRKLFRSEVYDQPD